MMQTNDIRINTGSISIIRTATFIILILILSLLLVKFSWYLVISPLLLIPLIIYNERIIYFYAIVAFLTLTNTISIELRSFVQFIFIAVLFYLFIKEYGLKFSEYPRVPRQIIFFIFILFSSMTLSTLFSSHVALGINETFRLAIFMIIIYIFYGFITKYNDIKIILFALLAAGIIYLGSVFYNFSLNNFSLIELNLNELLKVEDSYINVNGIGSFFVILISLLLCGFFTLKNKKNILFITSLVIFPIGLIITNSRAAILATAISTLFLLYFYNKKIFYRLTAAAIIIVPFLFIQPFSELIDLYFRVDRLTSGRNWIWEIVYNIVKNNSIFGAGPAGTKFEIYKNLPFMLGSPAERYIALHYNQIQFGHAHSFYLFFLTDLGIPGFITSLLLPFIFVQMGFRNMNKFKQNNNIEYYWLSAGITAAGIGLFVRGIFEWGNLISYGTLEADLPFWLIFIILIYLYKLPEKEFVENSNLNKVNILN